jgi:hypothetical protein
MKDSYNDLDLDNPFCLYCNSKCDIASWGTNNSVSENYTCLLCKENFEFIYVDDKIISVLFSCNQLQVLHLFEIQSFGIQKIDTDRSQPFNRVWIPEFKINFKDKQLLESRLSTYLLLS